MQVAKGKSRARLSCLMSLLLVFLLFAPALSASVEAAPDGSVYYVDATNGNDASSGTGEGESAWKTLQKVNDTVFQPGDQILFKRGESWIGTLHPKGSGAEDNPIVISAYGAEEDGFPLINGNGNESAVYLYNQQYWEIRELEVTNDNGDRSGINQRTKKIGIYVVNSGAGTLRHIRIDGNNVHDVYGNNVKDGNGSSGIKVRTMSGGVPSNYDGIWIEGNTVGPQVDRTGIDINSDYWCRPDSGCTGTPNWYPSHNVMIQNNYVQDIGGDGIVPMATVGAVVQYNTVNGFNMRSGVVNAGIWAWNADDTIIQFNEAFNGHSTQDGQGFDIDYAQTGTIVQYNYSHNNDGGFILICQPSGAVNERGIVRYNISQNDGARVFHLSGPTTNTRVYNNTIYSGQGSTTMPIHASSWGGYAKSISFENNLFYLEGAGAWQGLSNIESLTFDHNTIYGVHSTGEPQDANKSIEDPMLVYPGSGEIGRDTLDGYKLAQGSPALASGKLIADNGGLDYWGNSVSSSELPNRGAYNGTGILMEGDIAVSGLELDDRRVVLQLGERADIVIKVLPSNATDKTFAISNSADTVVSADGSFGSVQLEALAEGDAEIEVVTNDGEFSETIRVTVIPPFQYENQYIGNPDFEEEELAPWGSWKTGSVATDNAKSGANAGKIGNSEGSLEQAVSNLQPNTTYILTGHGKVTNGNDSMDIGVKNFGSGQVVASISDTDYKEAKFIFTTGPANTGAAVFCYRWNGSEPVYCDDFSLSEYVAALYVDEQELELKVGEVATIDAVVLPFAAPNRSVLAEIADPEIAEAHGDRGRITITAIEEGATTLTLTSVDGNRTVELNLTVVAAEDPDPGEPDPGEPDPGNPNPDAGNGSPNPSDDSPSVYLIEENELTSGEGGFNVTVNVKQGVTAVVLPQHAYSILDGKSLTIKSDALTVIIPAAVVEELAALRKDQNDQMILRMELADQKPSVNGHLKFASDMYHLELIVKTGDAAEQTLTQFVSPIEVVFPYDPALTDEELLGVYVYDVSSETWEYVGGVLNREKREIRTKLDHFSPYAVLEFDQTFEDVPSGYWAFRSLKLMSARHIVQGISETLFDPNSAVTRAEFVSMIARTLDLKGSGKIGPFQDVVEGTWYAETVNAAYEAGLIQGKSANEFAPNSPITREQMAVILVQAYAYQAGNALPVTERLSAYDDGNRVSLWARAAVNAAIEAELAQGRGKLIFAPLHHLTRAEAAQAILNLLKKQE